jgi:hypothetical protein
MDTATGIEIETAPLAKVLCDALETMAFISPLPLEGPCPPQADLLLVTIRFTGRRGGRLTLAAPRAFAQMLSSNILAASVDDPTVADGAGDALKELANVVCGSVIHETPGIERNSIEMGLPACRTLADTEWTDFLAHPGTSSFDADGCVIAARLEFEPWASK